MILLFAESIVLISLIYQPILQPLGLGVFRVLHRILPIYKTRKWSVIMFTELILLHLLPQTVLVEEVQFILISSPSIKTLLPLLLQSAVQVVTRLHPLPQTGINGITMGKQFRA